MAIHLSAVCEISQDLRYLSPARCWPPIGYHNNLAREEHAEGSSTACEIADEVRPNLSFGLDAWMCGEAESVPRREPCPSARRAHCEESEQSNPNLNAANNVLERCRCICYCRLIVIIFIGFCVSVVLWSWLQRPLHHNCPDTTGRCLPRCRLHFPLAELTRRGS